MPCSEYSEIISMIALFVRMKCNSTRRLHSKRAQGVAVFEESPIRNEALFTINAICQTFALTLCRVYFKTSSRSVWSGRVVRWF